MTTEFFHIVNKALLTAETKEMNKRTRQNALFLDRDGIINVDTGYVHTIKDFTFIQGIFEVCKFFQNLNYLLVVVSNQSGIGRGLFSESDLSSVDAWMIKQFRKKGLVINKTYYCPYFPGGKPGYEEFMHQNY